MDLGADELRTSSVSQLLRQFDIRPRKGLGQNFLISDGLLRRIVDAADLDQRDVVVEVGAGLGTLTRRLCERAGRVIALELDERLLPVLQQTLGPYRNVDVRHGDVLAFKPGDLVSPPYKMVANLPYYITSAVLRHFLEARAKPSLLVITMRDGKVSAMKLANVLDAMPVETPALSAIVRSAL